jgi:outer membrane protein OmpA-like peptidoglycan-associated protein
MNTSRFFWILFLFSSLSLQGQNYEKWELGLLGGVSQSQDDMNDFALHENNPAGAIFVRYHINPNLGFRANVLYGKLTSTDANYDDRAKRGFSFSSPVTEFSFLFEHDVFGHLRYKNAHDGSFKRIFSPYAFAGFAYTITNPETNYNESSQNAQKLALIELDKAQNTSKYQIPGIVGIGFKQDLSKRWLLQLEAGLRITWKDHLDGVSLSGNPNKNDTYTFLGLGLAYRFATDPDSDLDGIPDKDDACPNEAGSPNFQGCPDNDNDGIPDKDDACPYAKGPAELNGCPDIDGDGIADSEDLCPTLAGPAETKGCPDADGDGIQDKKDGCPNEPGPASNRGCPLPPDTDGDGIYDADDACPDQAGLAKFKGCPDTDGDGIQDKEDKCPNEPGVFKYNGCPAPKEVSVEDKKVLEAARYGVQFDSGKASFKAGSTAILDKVADIMKRYPQYELTISGYTDSQGSDATNLSLSKKRAEACYNYLIGKEISAERMSHNGYGEIKPVASNYTAEGRAKNRRVEFELTPKK